MSLDLHFEMREQFLYVELTGVFGSVDEANRLSARVFETADLNKATKILIDCLQVKGTPRFPDYYAYGAFVAEERLKHPHVAQAVKADNVLLAPVGGGASDTAGGGRAGSAVWSAAARVRDLPQRLRAAALPQERATDGGSFRGPPQPRDAGQYGAGMCPAAATAHGAVAPSGAGWNAHRCERFPWSWVHLHQAPLRRRRSQRRGSCSRPSLEVAGSSDVPLKNPGSRNNTRAAHG
jgi:hypothetical protein